MRLLTTFLALILMNTTSYAGTRNALSFKLKASVVKVHVGTKNGGHGVGTGVAIGEDLVVTNCHVLANSLGVKITKFGRGLVPVALRADWKHDLCILTFKYAGLSPVELGDSEQLQYEQEIFSIGFPGGPPKPQYTEGKIKALYPLDDSAIVRTSASFVMGASGSPVFDKDGKLLAISTFKSPGRNAYYYNLPVKWVKALLKQPETKSMATSVLPFWDAPEEKRPFFMRVVLPYKNEKWNDVDRIAQQWIKAEPKTTEAFYYAGIAKDKLGKKEEAKKYYEQTLALQPGHPAAKQGLACLADNQAAGCKEES